MAQVDVFDVMRVGLWFIAGLISLYFSVGSARIWTSISTGFFLVFISEGYLLAPWESNQALMAVHSVVGTIAVLVITHGFMEYYVFARTLESGGAKWEVYALTAGVLVASMVFLAINPTPTATVVRHIRIVENACWVFLVVINLDLLRKIHVQVRDTPIGPAFRGFGAVFFLIFLWRGSVLYLQAYGWDADAASAGIVTDAAQFPFRVGLATNVNRFASLLSSVTMGGTFLFLARAMR
ncbi:MAG: hypothetical protein Q8L48_43150 [Archangium sp.]|nr:hypothetical protein [Archangium sp.]